MPISHYMASADRAALVAWLMEAKHAVNAALAETQADEMYKDQKNRCLAGIDQARAKLTYAKNALTPFIEE